MPTKQETENLPASRNAKPPQCRVHDDVWGIESVRQNVCVKDLPLTEHADGKHYCLFHLPTQDKDVVKFEEIFRGRLDSVNQKVAEIEKLPEDERENAKNKLSYDFRYIWFPSEVSLLSYNFQVKAYFNSATFSSDADFNSATFSSRANFNSTTFSSIAYFNSATFSSDADFHSATFSSVASFRSTIFSSVVDFNSATFSSIASFRSATFSSGASFHSATFSSDANFDWATFSSDANFDSATFSSDANFDSTTFSSDASFYSATFSSRADFYSATFSSAANFNSATFSSVAYFFSATFSSAASFYSATFSSDAYFRSAKFGESSQIFFRMTRFQGVGDFRQAVVKGYLYFEAGEGEFFDGEWLDDEKTEPEKVKRRTSVFEGSLDFANVRAEKPERITFNKVRLRAGWFVNVDSRKFVFTDIKWENHRAGRAELKRELISLTRRSYKKPHNFQLLTVAFRNLAANAEEFNRFEEASNFRKSASECERLERLYRQRKWRREFKAQKGMSGFEAWRSLQTAPLDLVHFLYRYASFYGESWRRAALVLVGVLAVFGLLYAMPLSTFDYGAKDGRTVERDWSAADVLICGAMENLGVRRSMSVCEGAVHSLYVAALQRPEPKAGDTLTRLFIILETIFAPLQAALLALAIRRKFMR